MSSKDSKSPVTIPEILRLGSDSSCSKYNWFLAQWIPSQSHSQIEEAPAIFSEWHCWATRRGRNPERRPKRERLTSSLTALPFQTFFVPRCLWCKCQRWTCCDRRVSKNRQETKMGKKLLVVHQIIKVIFNESNIYKTIHLYKACFLIINNKSRKSFVLVCYSALVGITPFVVLSSSMRMDSPGHLFRVTRSDEQTGLNQHRISGPRWQWDIGSGYPTWCDWFKWSRSILYSTLRSSFSMLHLIQKQTHIPEVGVWTPDDRLESLFKSSSQQPCHATGLGPIGSHGTAAAWSN